MTLIISLVLTLLVFSYLLGDNPLFRLTVSVFVGLAAAFTLIVTVESVVLPLLDTAGKATPAIRLDIAVLASGSILATLLLLKPVVAFKSLTNIALGVLVAIGAAVSVVGAITGTLIPLSLETTTADFSTPLALASSLVMVIGVVTTLTYFQYFARETADGTVQRGTFSRVFGAVGEGFIALTLGALYGGAILTSLTILVGHLSTLF